MMSMKGDGKPVSFIEDCAVPLEHLAEYTDRLTRVFEKHGTRGTWYAHASVGTLHVRPVLDMRRDGAEKMRAIAEEACAMVKEYKGAYSGEHGDGLVRSEWIAPFFGPRLTAALGEIKSWLDPRGLMNPGKIVTPSRMDDKSLFRFKPGYRSRGACQPRSTGASGAATTRPSRCATTTATAASSTPARCARRIARRWTKRISRAAAPTRCGWRFPDQLGVRRSEGRARPLRLVQGLQARVPDRRRHGAHEDRVHRAVQGEARLHAARSRDRATCRATRPGPLRLPRLANARIFRCSRPALGFSAEARAAQVAQRTFSASVETPDADVVLFVDTFNRYFEPENARAALKVLRGRRASRARAARPVLRPDVPLGRAWWTRRRREAAQDASALAPYAARGVPIVGLEPSCLFSLRDEFTGAWGSAKPGEAARCCSRSSSRASRAGSSSSR